MPSTAPATAPFPPPLLKQKQLEAHFGVSNWTVNQWVRRGCPVERLPGGHRRFDLDAVREWMRAEAAAHQAAKGATTHRALRSRASAAACA